MLAVRCLEFYGDGGTQRVICGLLVELLFKHQQGGRSLIQ
jgi:hypothetical protein